MGSLTDPPVHHGTIQVSHDGEAWTNEWTARGPMGYADYPYARMAEVVDEKVKWTPLHYPIE